MHTDSVYMCIKFEVEFDKKINKYSPQILNTWDIDHIYLCAYFCAKEQCTGGVNYPIVYAVLSIDS